MYRISNDLDLSDIVGSELQQICIGKYDVQFRFSSGTFIAVQGPATILNRAGVIAAWNDEVSWTSLSFKQVLGRTVQRFSVPNNQLLEIHFEDGLVLQLHDNSDQYESMQIYLDGKPDQPIII